MNYFPKNVFVKIVRKFIQFWHSYRKKYILHFDKSRGVFCCPGITECEIGFNLIIQLENVNVYDISVATFGMLFVGLGHLNFEAYLSYLRFFFFSHKPPRCLAHHHFYTFPTKTR